MIDKKRKRRLSKISTFILASGIAICSLTPIKGQAANFNDVSQENIFYDEIHYLSSENLIFGFSNGTFKPNDRVTRAQAAIMIGRALGLNGNSKNTKFKDVTANVTGSGYIASAIEKGIINGFTDNTYRPNEPVTRGQMAIFLNRAFTLTKGEAISFDDVTSNTAAYQAILNVAANGIANGYQDGTYRPYEAVTRGQFSAFLARALEPNFRIPMQVNKHKTIAQSKAPVNQQKATEQPKASVNQQKATEQPKTPVNQQKNETVTSAQLSTFEQNVVHLVNQERAKNELPSLKIDNQLSKAARTKSIEMQTKNYFSHQSPTYGSPFEMIEKFGIPYSSAGENIAFGQASPQEVVNYWMNSSPHRANILNKSFTHIGVGYVDKENYWTAMFIAK